MSLANFNPLQPLHHLVTNTALLQHRLDDFRNHAACDTAPARLPHPGNLFVRPSSNIRSLHSRSSPHSRRVLRVWDTVLRQPRGGVNHANREEPQFTAGRFGVAGNGNGEDRVGNGDFFPCRIEDYVFPRRYNE
jgi:hypothetical protein